MKLTHEQIFAVFPAVDQLADSSALSGRVAVDAAKIRSRLVDDYQAIMQGYSSAAQEFGARDEEGNLLPTPNGQGVQIEDAESFSEAVEEVMDGEEDYDLPVLDFDAVVDAETGLTGNQLLSLLETGIAEE